MKKRMNLNGKDLFRKYGNYCSIQIINTKLKRIKTKQSYQKQWKLGGKNINRTLPVYPKLYNFVLLFETKFLINKVSLYLAHANSSARMKSFFFLPDISKRIENRSVNQRHDFSSKYFTNKLPKL